MSVLQLEVVCHLYELNFSIILILSSFQQSGDTLPLFERMLF